MFKRWRIEHMMAVGVLSLGLMACFCGSEDQKEPSRWDSTQTGSSKPTTERAPKSSKDAASSDTAAKPADGPVIKGGALNTYLPEDGVEGTSRVFTQEKDGYAEAKYSKDELEVVVSISDTRANPEAAGKFEDAADTVQGHPMMTRGKNASMALVKDRFQVRVSSKTLSPEERKAWLERVNLSQLAQSAP